MPGQNIHQLDAFLCRHVRDNVCWQLGEAGIAIRVERLDPRLADYVRLGHPDLEEVPPVGEHLLSEAEFDALVEVAGGLPAAIVPETLKTPERLWLSCDEFFQQTPQCTAEIRETLSPAEAQRWSERCNQFIALLTSGKLLLSEGIDVARQLSTLIRHYLVAMGELQFVPPPTGCFPTPTNPLPNISGAEAKYDEKTRVAIQRMRDAIRQHERGLKATPSALIKAAKINIHLGRKALRILEDLGEYQGHGRSKAKKSRG
jgi:hypothetical protein